MARRFRRSCFRTAGTRRRAHSGRDGHGAHRPFGGLRTQTRNAGKAEGGAGQNRRSELRRGEPLPAEIGEHAPAGADEAENPAANADIFPADEAEILTVRAAFSPADEAERESAADDAANAEAAAETSGAAPANRPRKAAGRGLLTGKVLPQDLPDARGGVLARAGTVVNADVIRTAMRHGKLFELTLLCCASSPFGLWR